MTVTAPGGAGTRTSACPRCGAECRPTDRFCENCGMPLVESASRRRLPTPSDHVEIDLGPRAAAVSDRGLRHARNEDAARVLVGAGGAVIAVVADGVSSSDEPHRAASAAVDAAARVLAAAGVADDETLTTAVHAATAAVAAVTDPRLLDPAGTPRSGTSVPACTLVAAHVSDQELAVVSVGDSRAYWIPDDGPGEQLSVDDSWVHEALAAGIEPAAAYADPRSHELTAWIGLDAELLQPHLAHRAVDGPGVVVVCSDGLWNYAPTCDELTALVREHLTAADHRLLPTAQSLTEFACAAGGRDNITIIVVRQGAEQ